MFHQKKEIGLKWHKCKWLQAVEMEVLAKSV